MKKKIGAFWAMFTTAFACFVAVLGLSFIGTGAFAAIGGSVTGTSNYSTTALVVLGGGTDQIMTTAAEMGESHLSAIATTADLDHGGILAQGEGNGFWTQLQTRADMESSARSVGAYSGVMQDGDCRSISAQIAAHSGVAVYKVIV